MKKYKPNMKKLKKKNAERERLLELARMEFREVYNKTSIAGPSFFTHSYQQEKQ